MCYGVLRNIFIICDKLIVIFILKKFFLLNLYLLIYLIFCYLLINFIEIEL